MSLYKRLFDSLCSCKDRTSERHRPNSRKKKPDSCLYSFSWQQKCDPLKGNGRRPQKNSFSWQQRLRLCVGVCPPHHVVGVVHLPLAPALRYSPLGNPEPLRTPLKLHAPAFLACAVFSLLPLLPSQAFSLFLMCWSPLPASPRAPCLVWFCLLALVPFVLVAVCGFRPWPLRELIN